MFPWFGGSMINFWSLCGEGTQTKWHKSTLGDLNAFAKKKMSWTLGSTALCQSINPDLEPAPFLFQWTIGYGQIASYCQRRCDSFIAVAWATCCLRLENKLWTYRKVCTKKCFQIYVLLKQRLLIEIDSYFHSLFLLCMPMHFCKSSPVYLWKRYSQLRENGMKKLCRI